MNCIQCENCKQNTPTYFCIAKNQIVINENYVQNTDKSKGKWKKGELEYEIHRRKTRKEIEV